MLKKLITIALCSLAFACGDGSYDTAALDEPESESTLATTQSDLINNGGNGVEGGKCTVVGGPNRGKRGRYDSEGACCDEGPNGWGCTECHGRNEGKCKDGHGATRIVTVPHTGGGGLVVIGN